MTFKKHIRLTLSCLSVTLLLSGCASTAMEQEIALLKEQLRQQKIAEEQAQIERERKALEEKAERDRQARDAEIQRKAEALAQQKIAREMQRIEAAENERQQRLAQQQARQEALAKAEQAKQAKAQTDREFGQFKTEFTAFEPNITGLTNKIENINTLINQIPAQDQKPDLLQERNNLIGTFNNLYENYQKLNPYGALTGFDPQTMTQRLQNIKESLQQLTAEFEKLAQDVRQQADRTKTLPWPGSSARNSRYIKPFLKSRFLSNQEQN